MAGSVELRGQGLQCTFDHTSLSYVGTPTEQAKCLLRPVLTGGHLGPQLADLPKPLDKLVGKPFKLSTQKLTAYLAGAHVSELNIGGALADPISRANLSDPGAPTARYFVIHDVSTPNYLDDPLPADIDQATWVWNDLSRKWVNKKVTHVYINRLGESATAVDFKSELPDPHHGTKFARDNLRQKGKGLYLHIELIQPRRRDPRGSPTNDALAPVPGFTDVQLERLALVYIAASARRGEWMVPAFHAAVDVGIRDAHDDPQNFDLNRWAELLQRLLKTIEKIRLK